MKTCMKNFTILIAMGYNSMKFRAILSSSNKTKKAYEQPNFIQSIFIQYSDFY